MTLQLTHPPTHLLTSGGAVRVPRKDIDQDRDEEEEGVSQLVALSLRQVKC